MGGSYLGINQVDMERNGDPTNGISVSMPFVAEGEDFFGGDLTGS